MAEELQISDLEYELPADLIAQHPWAPRDQARLMVVDRKSGRIYHRRVADLTELLQPPDLLIVNNTRVIPARLFGHRKATGGKWEGLFLRQSESGLWEMLSQTKGKLLEGEELEITGAPFRLNYRGRSRAGHFLMEPIPPESPITLLERYGHVPLPPYIRDGHDSFEDRSDYQTIFAQEPGSVAAPTASLHFTPELLRALDTKGIARAAVTLHVGIGTFQPIKSDSFSEHVMHEEWCAVPSVTADAITHCRRNRGRIVAVGTTSVRTLESAASSGEPQPWNGTTNLFIRPPYAFRTVDALMTNFHLPRSTLLALVFAFAGKELIRHAYREAVGERYRFFSYGDAMLIL